MKCPRCRSELLVISPELNGETTCESCGLKAANEAFAPSIAVTLVDLCATLNFYTVHTPQCDARIRLKPSPCNCGLQEARDFLKKFGGI